MNLSIELDITTTNTDSEKTYKCGIFGIRGFQKVGSNESKYCEGGLETKKIHCQFNLHWRSRWVLLVKRNKRWRKLYVRIPLLQLVGSSLSMRAKEIVTPDHCSCSTHCLLHTDSCFIFNLYRLSDLIKPHLWWIASILNSNMCMFSVSEVYASVL